AIAGTPFDWERSVKRPLKRPCDVFTYTSFPFGCNSILAAGMCFTLELFDTPDIPKVLAQCKRVLRPGGRLVVVAVSKVGKEGFIIHAFEWTHRHFPNLMDCRPIYARRALEATGFVIDDSLTQSMWVPVEIVRGRKPS
ncbi:MAG: class I SAM-dependent methyltransferase, partial [Thermoguttaceae bacterium]